jgi:hypothetical protein
MRLKVFVGRFVPMILMLSVASGTLRARGQQKESDALSDKDKAEIVESVLQLELKAQSPMGFKYVRSLSSDNIEFVERARISKQGFDLLNPSQIRSLKENQFVEYLVFRRIGLKDGIAVVLLSRVNEGRPCFGPAFSKEESFTYEYRKTAGEWNRRLVKGPLLPFLLRRSLSRKM